MVWTNLDGGTILPANLMGVSAVTLSVHTALLLFPSAIGVSMLTLWISGGSKALIRFWRVALCAGGFLMLITCLCSRFLPVDLAGFLAGGCIIAFVLIWGQIDYDGARFSTRDYRNISKVFPCTSALLPYFLLLAGIGATRLIPPVRYFLQMYGVFAIPAIKLHLALLYSPGVWLLLAVLAHLPLLSLQRTHLVRVQMKTAQQLLPGVLALVNFLATASLMQDSGMTALLTKAVTTYMNHAVWTVTLIGPLREWLMNAYVANNTLMMPMLKTYLAVSFPWLIAAQYIAIATTSALAPLLIITLSAAAGLFGTEVMLVRSPPRAATSWGQPGGFTGHRWARRIAGSSGRPVSQPLASTLFGT